ncbi:MAG: helix-turn-helix transcriptional regulator [Gammaproteobacteria bacterium]|jgi:DNA-binding phage protein|nr:helix-turn-helix transcriptional regulator [Gammaproteobacteria bacterium]
MSDLEQIREKLQDRNIQAVAKATGLHANSIYKFVNGGTEPKYATIKALSDYLSGEKENG